jgi:FG-GAP-like repeat
MPTYFHSFPSKHECLTWYVPAEVSSWCKTLHLDAGLGKEDTAQRGLLGPHYPHSITCLRGADDADGQRGGGQFKKVAYYGAGQRPSQVITADFNNDGNADLVFADWLSNQLVILLGNGDGIFQKPITIRVPSPTSLAAGDLDGDGNLDLVVTESGGSGSGSLAVYLGEGNGKFRLNATYGLGAYAGVVSVADFDGDGNLDVAVGDEGKGSSGVVRIFRGNGKGTLRKPVIYQVGAWLGLIAAGDLNGDHFPDLAVTGPMDGSVAVFMNDGKGKFLKPVTYSAGGGEAVDVKIADLRSNGDQDLVVANTSQGLVVLLNKGDGTFGSAKIYPPCTGSPPCESPQAVAVADFNLDGHIDAAVATHIDDSYFYYGKGDGTFGLAKHLKNTIQLKGGFSIAAGDFDNDGAPDLAMPIQNYGKVAILLNAK